VGSSTRSVVFVAPFFAETTLRFVEAAASLPGVALGLVSQDPADLLPEGLRHRLAAHRRLPDAMDPAQIGLAVREIGRRIGRPARLIGALEGRIEVHGDLLTTGEHWDAHAEP